MTRQFSRDYDFDHFDTATAERARPLRGRVGGRLERRRRLDVQQRSTSCGQVAAAAVADFSRWLKQKHIAVRALDTDVVARFLRLRRRQQRVRRGDPFSMRGWQKRDHGRIEGMIGSRSTAKGKQKWEIKLYCSRYRIRGNPNCR
jgi:hypothetical protein